MRPKLLSWTVSITCIVILLATEMAFVHKPKHQEPSVVDPATLPDPKPDDTCFSPEEPCDAKLLRFILGAKKSLDIAIYDINLDQLVQNLAEKAKEIAVRVVVDQRQSKGGHSLVDLLVKAGVNVRYGRQRGIMHNKLIIRDGTMVETGSFNYTNHAATANNENQVYLNTPAIVDRYKDRFEKIWSDADPIVIRPTHDAPVKQAEPTAAGK